MTKLKLQDVETRRIVLIGVPGCGKSSLGNTLLRDTKAFKTSCAFKPVTSNVQCGVGEWKGKDIFIFDTPGVNRNLEKRVQDQEWDIIRRGFWSLSPGFHAIAVVLSIGRLSTDTIALLQDLKELFGEEYMKFVFFIFTRLDEIDDGMDLEQVISQADTKFKRMFENTLHIGINNKEKDPRKIEDQISRFFQCIEEIHKKNGFKCYTNEYFQIAYYRLKKKAASSRKPEEEIRMMEPTEEHNTWFSKISCNIL